MPEFIQNAKQILRGKDHIADCVDAETAELIVGVMNGPHLAPADARDRIGALLGDDPVCNGRVSTATIEAITDLISPAPLIAFHEAERVGRILHDHWQKMAGEAPMKADDMGWGDIVQFVVRNAREVAAEREQVDG